MKARQANVIELHVALSTNAVQIQTCLLDIMNYTVKQLKGINRTLDMQEITLENCVTKNFHKILQSQLDSVWHQLSTRTKEYVQDLKVLRSMIINLIHDDAVSFYGLVNRYRTPEYAKVNSGWILLDSAEQLFALARARVFNSKKEFDPEMCPKWQCLTNLLTSEIPDDVKKKKSGELKNTKILILCHDSRTCSQLNSYLTMGPKKYLFFRAFQKEVTVNTVSAKYKGSEAFVNQIKKKKESEKGKNTEIEVQGELTLDDEEPLDLDAESNKSCFVLTLTQLPEEKSDNVEDSVFEPCSQMEDIDLSTAGTQNPLICIQTFKEDGSVFTLERTLNSLKPDYIIMYHSDVSAVRQIELFEGRKNRDDPVSTVYFILHDKTVEEQAYLTALKREKQAFELLIQTKSVMVVPTYQDGKSDDFFSLHDEPEEESLDTRKAGGQALSKEKPFVIVDMREFRSDLPALLHKRGIDIEPVTIAIGDYVLTPEICVERKSISDLIGSLNSGRLFTQCTHMCRNYSRPILLIEFDQNKPFNLQGQFVVSSDMSGADIQQKLQLLTIHFPRLKLVWSPSPYATAELFYELKQGRKNPVVSAVTALGGEGADEASLERYNSRVHDFLLKLPGVTHKNLSRVMNKGGSLERLVNMTQEELTTLIDNKREAQTLYNILHVNSKPPDVANKEDKTFKRKYTGKIFKTTSDKK